MKKYKIIVILNLLSFIILCSSNYTILTIRENSVQRIYQEMFSQYSDIPLDEFSDQEDTSLAEYTISFDEESELTKGLVIKDDNLILIDEGLKLTFNYEEMEIESLYDIYDNVISIQYSKHLLINHIIFLIITTLINLLYVISVTVMLGFTLNFIFYRQGKIIDYRDFKFQDNLLLTSLSTFALIGCYSFMRFLIGSTVLVFISITIGAIVYFRLYLKTVKRLH